MLVLETIFEPELLKELRALPIQKFQEGDVLIEEFCTISTIPILIKGKIEVLQTDHLNEESHHQAGDIVNVKVHASDEHDLWANSVN